MRKILLGTTAMVAAGFCAGHAQAADPISLQLGGYYRVAFYGIMNQSDASACAGATGCVVTETAGGTRAGIIGDTIVKSESGFDRRRTAFSTDGEVHFNGSTTLDNGIGVAVRIELEVMDNGGVGTGSQDVIDEHYMTLSGGFGKIQIGVDDTIGNSYATTAPLGAGMFGVNSPGFVASNTPKSNSTVLTMGGDSASIRYETPSLAGFRVGFSYSPDSEGIAKAHEANLGQDGTLSKSNGLGAVYGVGAAYAGSFGDVGVNWSASGAYGSNDAVSCGSLGVYSGGCKDRWEFQSGLNVSFLGFSVGGSYRHGRNSGGVDGDSADVWDAGVNYNTGPVTVGMTMSRGSYNSKALTAAASAAGVVTHNGGNNFAGGAGAGTLTVVQLGATYALGPGVSLQGAVTWDEFDSRQSGITVTDARSIRHLDYSSWSGGLALGLSF